MKPGDKAGEGTGDRAGDGGRGDFKAPAAPGPAGYGTGMAPGLRAPPPGCRARESSRRAARTNGEPFKAAAFKAGRQAGRQEKSARGRSFLCGI